MPEKKEYDEDDLTPNNEDLDDLEDSDEEDDEDLGIPDDEL